MYGFLKKLGFIILVVMLWEGVFRFGLWPDYLFPSPLTVLDNLWAGITSGQYLLAAQASLGRVFLGFGFALLLGIPLGLGNARIHIFQETLSPMVIGLQSLPSICWLPLAILWFGLNERAIIFVVTLGALFSIAVATEAGVKNVQPIYIKAAQNMGARGWKIYHKVIFPAALPSIVTGMKIGWSFAWRALMAGELLSSGVGLGQILMLGRDLGDMPRVVAVMILIGLLGLLVDQLIFATWEQRVRRKWGLWERT